MPHRLEGRHIVITGGDGALGQEVVRAFVAAGATCHLPVFGAGADAGPGTSVTGTVDLSNEGAVEGYYAGLPPIAASIHIAGGFKAGPFVDSTRADLVQQLDLNLVTAFLCCREAVRNMLRHGDGGRIVNVGSRAVESPAREQVAYTISKSGVVALTRALAVEVRDHGILVNAVLPSIIDTPANRAAMPNAKHDRWPRAEEIARTILWLASPENGLTSGALIPVYGRA
jgi:NAD(P)-dependent dehydrogenase (short-subunit alcohol dehydrogenase family)